VVQPETTEELSKLAARAHGMKVPLIPRGKATSGYGGVVPTRGGIVVDMRRMASVLGLDEEAGDVRVQAGTTWQALDRALASDGMTLRLYPSSYPSSTVGGWLAQGGAGFGSYQYGYFRENVVAATVVLAGGEVREVSGEELGHVLGGRGHHRVHLRRDPQGAAARGYRGRSGELRHSGKLQGFMASLLSSDAPVWSVMFINPRMAEMKNRTPAPSGHAPQAAEVVLPSTYIVVISFRSRVAEQVRPLLAEIAGKTGASKLPDEIALHEWRTASG